MKIGLDFDNTIVNYDKVFHKVALEWKLISQDFPVNKLMVRNYLRKIGKENRWTEMQGYVYGSRMDDAESYEGVVTFIEKMLQFGHQIVIISHKTQFPFTGPQYDLRKAAKSWLNNNISLKSEHIFFEPTKEKKNERIISENCDIFIDDLPEILKNPLFPKQTFPILFDPDELHANDSLNNCSSWKEIEEISTVFSNAKELLQSSKKSEPILSIQKCSRGGNNQTFKITTEKNQFLYKKYFSHIEDQRDRLGAEFTFLSLASQAEKRCVPFPFSSEPKRKIALYEFIDGTPFNPTEITQSDIEQAIDFFTEINSPDIRKKAMHLKNGSESCFSLQEHFELIEKRISQIRQIPEDSEITLEAKKHANDLHQFWDLFKKEVIEDEKDHFHTPLSIDQRCISPSDFGFHNALKKPCGKIYFLDFEYAGWDDPCKMAGDFFSQIAIPVPTHFFELFIDKTLNIFPGPIDLKKRATILKTAYQIKWSCIALNVFLPYHLERRKFANPNLDIALLQSSQLEKAKNIIEKLNLTKELYGIR